MAVDTPAAPHIAALPQVRVCTECKQTLAWTDEGDDYVVRYFQDEGVACCMAHDPECSAA